jgi:formiminotetrahydrofolate cyclodeaminase
MGEGTVPFTFFFSYGEHMKFPITLVLEDTSKDQVNGLRKAIAKDNKAFKALVLGGYELPKEDKPKADKPKAKPASKK